MMLRLRECVSPDLGLRVFQNGRKGLWATLLWFERDVHSGVGAACKVSAKQCHHEEEQL